MTLLERLQAELVTAMKEKDEARLGTLRLMKAALQKHEIDAMKPLDEATGMQVLTTLTKQRRESADMFRQGGREDLAAIEESELKMIEAYLPTSASEHELQNAVTEALAETGATSSKQMGLVMKAVGAKLAGKRVDNQAISNLVKARLA